MSLPPPPPPPRRSQSNKNATPLSGRKTQKNQETKPQTLKLFGIETIIGAEAEETRARSLEKIQEENPQSNPRIEALDLVSQLETRKVENGVKKASLEMKEGVLDFKIEIDLVSQLEINEDEVVVKQASLQAKGRYQQAELIKPSEILKEKCHQMKEWALDYTIEVMDLVSQLETNEDEVVVKQASLEAKGKDQQAEQIKPSGILQEKCQQGGEASVKRKRVMFMEETEPKKKAKLREQPAEQNKQSGVKAVDSCRIHLKGECQQGDPCQFSHNIIPNGSFADNITLEQKEKDVVGVTGEGEISGKREEIKLFGCVIRNVVQLDKHDVEEGQILGEKQAEFLVSGEAREKYEKDMLSNSDIIPNGSLPNNITLQQKEKDIVRDIEEEDIFGESEEMRLIGQVLCNAVQFDKYNVEEGEIPEEKQEEFLVNGVQSKTYEKGMLPNSHDIIPDGSLADDIILQQKEKDIVGDIEEEGIIGESEDMRFTGQVVRIDVRSDKHDVEEGEIPGEKQEEFLVYGEQSKTYEKGTLSNSQDIISNGSLASNITLQQKEKDMVGDIEEGEIIGESEDMRLIGQVLRNNVQFDQHDAEEGEIPGEKQEEFLVNGELRKTYEKGLLSNSLLGELKEKKGDLEGRKSCNSKEITDDVRLGDTAVGVSYRRHCGAVARRVLDENEVKKASAKGVEDGVKTKCVVMEEIKQKNGEKRREKEAEQNKPSEVKSWKLQPFLKEKNHCRYYLHGNCHRGDSCKFSHDMIPLAKSKVRLTDSNVNSGKQRHNGSTSQQALNMPRKTRHHWYQPSRNHY